MIVERKFIGNVNIQKVLSSIINYQIDKNVHALYDKNRANAIPSKSEGVAIK